VRLIDQEPFDTIVLNEQNQGRVLKVLPLTLPGRQLPANPRPTDTLRVRLTSNPGEELDVSWGGIARVVLFEQQVLDEARQLMAARKFDEAFEYLTFVHDRNPKTAGLDETVDQLLFTEASSLFQQGRYERALLLLDEIYQRTPNRRGLVTALSRVLDRSFEASQAHADYPQLRRQYELAQSKYGTALQELLDRWRQRLESLGQDMLKQMRADLDAGRLREAYLAGRRLMELWPATPGAEQAMAQAMQRYPLLSVGVQELAPATPDAHGRIQLNWAARRAQRLRMRELFEFIGVGPDGGQYECSVGRVEPSESNRALTIHLETPPAGGLSGVHIAQLLLQRGAPHSSLFDPTWAALVERVGAADLNTASADFRRPYLRAASLLSIPLDAAAASDIAAAWQPYTAVDSSENAADEQRFVINPRYVKATATQPREIVEHHFETPQRALRALRRGEIDLVDRVFPGDVDQLKRDAQLVVASYRLPCLHVLVPNPLRTHVGNRLFRRGLAYAIDRETILKRDLLAGTNLPGCQVISGPFSPGVSADDPIAYAYDARIEPRAYDPRHARTLIQLAQIELLAVAEKSQTKVPELRELTLVHPSHEIARVACAEIVEDLKVIGLPCTLKMLASGQTRPSDDDWDLLYVDYVMPEPLADAGHLLAAQGFVGSPSAHLNLALRQLEHVDSWNRAGERLRVIHQLCFDDTTIIPLWQLVEHLAYRQGMQGVIAEPVTTYQQIEAWRLVTAE
jgi:hypothetical protein